jgi:hypothetical protein
MSEAAAMQGRRQGLQGRLSLREPLGDESYTGVVVCGVDDLYQAQRKMLFLEPAYDPREAAGRWVPRQLCRYILWATLGDILRTSNPRGVHGAWRAAWRAWAEEELNPGVDETPTYLAQVMADLRNIDLASQSSAAAAASTTMYISMLQSQVDMVLATLQDARVLRTHRPSAPNAMIDFPTSVDIVPLSIDTPFEQSVSDLSWQWFEDSLGHTLPEYLDDTDFD